MQMDDPEPDGRVSPGRKGKKRRKLPRLAVDAAGLAEMLFVSERSIQTYDSGGLIPRPFKLSGRTLWNVPEIRRWLDAGAPRREVWEAMKKADRG